MIIKGKRSVVEALQSPGQVDRIVVQYQVSKRKEIQSILQLARRKHIKVQVVSSDEFDREFSSDTHTQGICAYVRLLESISLEDVYNQPQDFPVVVAVDHLQDPHNFGAIIRSCECLGVNAILYPKDRNCNITPGVIKASSGAVNHIPLIKVTNIAQSLQHFKDNGYWIYGAAFEGAQSLHVVTPQAPLVLVVGNEEKGISRRVLKMLDVVVKIPLRGKVQSLNVSVATGILVYDVLRKLDSSASC